MESGRPAPRADSRAMLLVRAKCDKNEQIRGGSTSYTI